MAQLRIGIIGMGGFAGVHHRAVRDLEREGRCRLVCTCDPGAGAFAALADELDLDGRGVAVEDTYETMLDRYGADLDLVVVPTPVTLHREMHLACVERGIPVYLEKPPTLDWGEMEAMLEAEQRAARETHVGFNWIMQAPRRELKRRIVDGEFGRLVRVSLRAGWPRGSTYYGRAAWAGRLAMGDQLVLDSPLGNACSHLLFNLLDWAGTGDVHAYADPVSVRAELYRAHPIEGADTLFVSAVTADGAELRAAVTHTGAGGNHNPETVVCKRATIRYDVRHGYRVVHADGMTESGDAGKHAVLRSLHRSYYDYLEGKAERPPVSLGDCVSFVRLIGLVYVAAGTIHSIGPEFRSVEQHGDDERVRVAGMEQAIERFDLDGVFPSEQDIPWGRPGGVAAAPDIRRLREVVAGMVLDREAGTR